MSQKDDTKALLLALLMTVGIVVGLWWLTKHLTSSKSFLKTVSSQSSPLSERMSTGENLLIPSVADENERTGVAALAVEDYQKAVTELEKSLQVNKNNPEALIYLNNARIGQEKAYTIAVVVPVSTDIDSTQEILRGVAQAQNTINQAGGIKGIPLKILIVNDDDNPQIAQQVAQSLASQSEVLGVLGHSSSDVTLATASIYESAKLVAISPVSTSVKLSGLSHYIFRTVPSDRFAGSSLSRYQINELKKQKAAVFFQFQKQL